MRHRHSARVTPYPSGIARPSDGRLSLRSAQECDAPPGPVVPTPASRHLEHSEDVPNGKPAPDCFLLAADRLGVPTRSPRSAMSESSGGPGGCMTLRLTSFSAKDMAFAHHRRGVTVRECPTGIELKQRYRRHSG